MSPNNPVAPPDEVDAVTPLSPTLPLNPPPQAEPLAASPADLAPPATVRELTSTIADSRAVIDKVPTAVGTRPASKPLPPALERPSRRPPAWRRRLTMLTMAAGAAALVIVINRPAAGPQLPPIADQVLQEGQQLRLDLAAVNRDQLPRLQYELVGNVPPLLQLAADTGELVWPTNEWHGPSQQTIRVRAVVAGQPDRFSEMAFQVTVAETLQPPRFATPAVNDIKREDGIYYLQLQARDLDVPSGELTYAFSATPTLIGPARIDPRTGLFTWQPASQEYGQTFTFVFRAGKHPSAMAETSLTLTLPDFGDPIDFGEGFSRQRFLGVMQQQGFTFEMLAAGEPSHGGILWQYRFKEVLMLVVEYPTAQAAKRAVPEYVNDDDLLMPEPIRREGPKRLYHQHRLIVLTLGDEPGLIRCLTGVLRPPQKVVATTGSPGLNVSER